MARFQIEAGSPRDEDTHDAGTIVRWVGPRKATLSLRGSVHRGPRLGSLSTVASLERRGRRSGRRPGKSRRRSAASGIPPGPWSRRSRVPHADGEHSKTKLGPAPTILPGAHMQESTSCGIRTRSGYTSQVNGRRRCKRRRSRSARRPGTLRRSAAGSRGCRLRGRPRRSRRRRRRRRACTCTRAAFARGRTSIQGRTSSLRSRSVRRASLRRWPGHLLGGSSIATAVDASRAASIELSPAPPQPADETPPTQSTAPRTARHVRASAKNRRRTRRGTGAFTRTLGGRKSHASLHARKY